MFQIVSAFANTFQSLFSNNQNAFSESVLQQQSGLWLNKKGDMMAFLKLNDTKVESISFQNLDTSSTITGTSSSFGELKYAKVSVLHKTAYSNTFYPHYLRDFETDSDRQLGLYFAFSFIKDFQF